MNAADTVPFDRIREVHVRGCGPGRTPWLEIHRFSSNSVRSTYCGSCTLYGSMGSLQTTSSSDITAMLRRWSGGDASALNLLLPVVHGELLQIAKRNLRRRSESQTLEPAALVNEAYLRFTRFTENEWTDRAHFFAVSALVMRRVLVDRARARSTGKRSDGLLVTLCGEIGAPPLNIPDLLDLDSALTELEALDPRRARIVELRFFTGASVEETAVALDISAPTVKRDWAVAKAWMRRRLHGSKTAQA